MDISKYYSIKSNEEIAEYIVNKYLMGNAEEQTDDSYYYVFNNHEYDNYEIVDRIPIDKALVRFWRDDDGE